MAKKSNTKEFIEKSKKVHGDKYDYSEVVYINNCTKVKIICPEHGLFYKRPTDHISGSGCPKCVKCFGSQEYFVERAAIIHKNKYDYSNVNYKKSSEKVCIICPIHGEFWQTPASHLSGCGCLKCRYDKKRSTKIFGIGVNDNESYKIDKCYDTWYRILMRCYCEKYHKRFPTYIGCSVCNEWLYFSNFKKWFDDNYIEGCSLDKDILVYGNKVYSPDTCCFVPHEINNIFRVNKCKHNGYIYDNGVYKSIIYKNGGKYFLGNFESKEEAIKCHIYNKDLQIKELCEKFYKIGLLSEKTYKHIANTSYSDFYYYYHPDEVMVKMKPDQIILTAVYQTMYLNELVCLCVHDIKPSISKIDKESQKIYKAALRRVREYESWMAKITSDSGNVYADFNDIMDETIRPLVDECRNEMYDFLGEEKGVENPYVCTLVELAKQITKFSITEISNRIQDTLKYDKSAVSLRTYEQKELLTILENLSKWLFRKQKEDINLNESTYLVNAWTRLATTINNSNVIATAIVNAQQLNDNENESKD